jgi:protein-L-isoaspartate(D-aspartate) O-methyltransferase
VTHVGDERVFGARFLCPARFIPCIGAQDADASRLLAMAFRSGAQRDVRSLRLLSGSTIPDHTAWFVGAGWWLSTAAAPGARDA